jgi:hypothetical protein
MARAQLLEASVRRQALAHIAQCAACADRLAEQQALTAAVRTTAKSLRDEGASAQVEQSLRAAFRKQANAAPARGFAPTRARQWPKRTLVAMAAALLLIVLAGAIRQWSFVDRKQKVAEVRPIPQTPLPAGNKKTPLLPGNQPERETVRDFVGQRRRSRRPVQRSVENGEEVTTDFFALADENELVPLESGQVLRIKLPGSTLISMGFPITAESASQNVLADLLVGQDGQARAIRFVRPGEAADTGSLQPNNK